MLMLILLILQITSVHVAGSWVYLSNALCGDSARLERIQVDTLDTCQQKCLEHPACSHLDYWSDTMRCNLRAESCENRTLTVLGVSSYYVNRNMEWKSLGIGKACNGKKTNSPSRVGSEDCLNLCKANPECSYITYLATQQKRCFHYFTCDTLDANPDALSFSRVINTAPTTTTTKTSTTIATMTTTPASATTTATKIITTTTTTIPTMMTTTTTTNATNATIATLTTTLTTAINTTKAVVVKGVDVLVVERTAIIIGIAIVVAFVIAAVMAVIIAMVLAVRLKNKKRGARSVKSSNKFFGHYDTRDSDVERKLHPPIYGLKGTPEVDLATALKQVKTICEEKGLSYPPEFDCLGGNVYSAQQFVDMHWEKLEQKYGRFGLTKERAMFINFYTHESPFYIKLNEHLRDSDRSSLAPYFPFIKGFLSALYCLPLRPGNVKRGVALDLSTQYSEDYEGPWWSFNSTTGSVGVLNNRTFLGNKGKRTMFDITARSLVSISEFSSMSEEELILLPGTILQVVSVLKAGNGLTIIQMKEKELFVPMLDFAHPDLQFKW